LERFPLGIPVLAVAGEDVMAGRDPLEEVLAEVAGLPWCGTFRAST
jgi:hypothetical protein